VVESFEAPGFGMKKILVVGEANVDLILQGYKTFPSPGKEVVVDDFVMTLGGASSLCAAALARLGNPVSFVGKVGTDLWGDYCLETMNAAGVDTSRIIQDPSLRTGITVSITSSSDRALISFVGSIGALRGEDVPEALLEGYAHLHISSYFLQGGLRDSCRELFARAHLKGLTTSLDPGFDPLETWDGGLLATLEHVDLFFPNEVELQGVTGRADPVDALRALENGRTLTVGKLGSKGAVLLDHGTPLSVPAFPLKPVDTTGAGDSFNAGFLHGFLAGSSLRDSMLMGTACGGHATLGLGGAATQVGPEELRALLKGRV
jgi:sugar/nucleoside kinase (ribokinase family)